MEIKKGFTMVKLSNKEIIDYFVKMINESETNAEIILDEIGYTMRPDQYIADIELYNDHITLYLD